MSWRKFVLLACAIASACSPAADPPPSETAPLHAGTPLPCDVAKVLHDKCWTCHGDKLDYTAPMHLTTWEATQAPTKSDPATPIYKRLKERIHDAANPMPPPAWPTRPTPDEIAVLDRWVDAGGPRGDGSSAACQPPVQPMGAGGGGNVGGSGAGARPGAGGGTGVGGRVNEGGTAGVGGGIVLPPGDGGLVDNVDVPVKPDPSECTMIPVHARANASGAPFSVPTGEQYYCFSFKLPFNGPTQALSFAPHEDNHGIVHHWLLYKMGSPQVDGFESPCIGFHADGALLAGWTLGSGEWNMPKDVGMNLGGGDFILEVHYNNTGAPVPDTSGVDICSTTKLRPKSAGIFWLGTPAIALAPATSGIDIKSSCKPTLASDFHVLRSWPHMHKLGVRMRADVQHPGGTVTPLFDHPFDFNAQVQLDTPYILKAGDAITTTCTYNNTTTGAVTFGESTSQEMCFNFTVGYPDTAVFPGGFGPTACNNN
jgi:hypothetical protein